MAKDFWKDLLDFGAGVHCSTCDLNGWEPLLHPQLCLDNKGQSMLIMGWIDIVWQSVTLDVLHLLHVSKPEGKWIKFIPINFGIKHYTMFKKKTKKKEKLKLKRGWLLLMENHPKQKFLPGVPNIFVSCSVKQWLTLLPLIPIKTVRRPNSLFHPTVMFCTMADILMWNISNIFQKFCIYVYTVCVGWCYILIKL